MRGIGYKTGRKILKIGNLLNYMRTIDLEQKNLTPAQSDTMIYFASNEGMSAADLAKHLEITHQAARNIVERLKSKNYLYTVSSKNDGRVNSVYLTEEGKKIYALLNDISMTAISAVLCLIFLNALVGVREGTVIAAFIVGPIIRICQKVFKPLGEKLLLDENK